MLNNKCVYNPVSKKAKPHKHRSQFGYNVEMVLPESELKGGPFSLIGQNTETKKVNIGIPNSYPICVQ